MNSQDLRYTHPNNFYDISFSLIANAWRIYLQNKGKDPKSTGKKSHKESVDSALAILILVMNLEADLRLKYDGITERSDETSKNIHEK